MNFSSDFLDLVSSGPGRYRDPVSYCSSRVQSAPAFIPGLRRVSTDMEVSNSNSTGVSLPVREIMRRLACHTISDIEVISVVIQDIIFQYYNVQQSWINFLPSYFKKNLAWLAGAQNENFFNPWWGYEITVWAQVAEMKESMKWVKTTCTELNQKYLDNEAHK